MDKKTNFFQYTNNFIKTSHVLSIPILESNLRNKSAVTIAIPTYKRSNLLKITIDSALNQYGYDDYNVIVIDNNPERNDATEQLLLTYNNSKLSYFKNEQNIGMCGNWNRFFELSQTQWTVMLHDDDILSPYYLETISRYLDDNISLIKPQIVKFYNNENLEYPKYQCTLPLRKLALTDFMLGCAIGAPSHVIFQTKDVIQLGGFNEDFYPTFDFVFNLQCVKCKNIYMLPYMLGGYRVLENESLQQSTMKRYFQNRLIISAFILRNLHVPKLFIKIIHFFAYPLWVGDIGRKYKMKYKMNIVYHILPDCIGSFVVRVFSYMVKAINNVY
ncbi:MAG: glycosyltransferase [Tannerellaceae bacterium]|jgi:glycosyltransferase involved in cell wall biosynthesis|nr:glycosyltransferase [Tannerellaceae bacterium]